MVTTAPEQVQSAGFCMSLVIFLAIISVLMGVIVGLCFVVRRYKLSELKRADSCRKPEDRENPTEEQQLLPQENIRREQNAVSCALYQLKTSDATVQATKTLLQYVIQQHKLKVNLQCLASEVGDFSQDSDIRVYPCDDTGRLQTDIKDTFKNIPTSDLTEHDILVVVHPMHPAGRSDRMTRTRDWIPRDIADTGIRVVDIRVWDGKKYDHKDNSDAAKELRSHLSTTLMKKHPNESSLSFWERLVTLL